MVDMEPSMSTLEFSLQVLPNCQTHLMTEMFMPVSPQEITKVNSDFNELSPQIYNFKM